MPRTKKTLTSALAARSDHDRVRLLREDAARVELATAAKNAVEENGRINPHAAAQIAHEALRENVTLPEPVRLWLMHGLAKYLSSPKELVLDDVLGLTTRGSGNTSAIKRAFLKQRNEIFAGLFWLLTSNGASRESAAGLILARDKFLRSLDPQQFVGCPEFSTPDKAVSTLVDYWDKRWKKNFFGKTVPTTDLKLNPEEIGKWSPGAAHLVWLNVPQCGWPKQELEKARAAGLKI